MIPVSPRRRAARPAFRPLRITGAVAPPAAPPPGRTVAATDAAANPRRRVAASARVTTAGAYAVHAYPQPVDTVGASAAHVAELRAIAETILAYDGTSLLIVTDSDAAAAYIRRWQAGHWRFPPGYRTAARRGNGKASTLEKGARRVAAHPDRVELHLVTGHTGHPLNEVTDSLARAALRSWNDTEQLRELADLWVARALTEHHQTAARHENGHAA